MMPVSSTADGQDVVPQLVRRVVACGDKRCVAGHLRWLDGGMPRLALGASGDCLEDGGVAAPRADLMLRPLLSDVPDDVCEVTTNQVFPASQTWHALLLRALSGIPDVKAGDSVWWHCDMIHSVAPVTNQQGWGNVMYIPAAPWCPRNEVYAEQVRAAFVDGASPSDFPAEHYEKAWGNRFRVEDLNTTGRQGLGLT